MSSGARAWDAVARLHQTYLTGLLLALLSRCGEATTAAWVELLFRRQHDEKFLRGLRSLGLDHEPSAVACAHFFDLANRVGGVGVECRVESPSKAWIRYPPPRWIYEGPALCAVPDAVTEAFLRGFHARCGDSLGNPRLGFVCTAMTTRGDPGLEGYFIEEEAELQPSERLRFRFDEASPFGGAAPELPLPFADERLAKARRNYAVQYIRLALPALVEVLGDLDRAADEALRSARLVALSQLAETVELVGMERPTTARTFLDFLSVMLEGCGARVERDGGGLSLRCSRLPFFAPGPSRWTPELLVAWSGLWQGALALCERSAGLEGPVAGAGDTWCWSLKTDQRTGSE